jgi:hypothetical protein
MFPERQLKIAHTRMMRTSTAATLAYMIGDVSVVWIVMPIRPISMAQGEHALALFPLERRLAAQESQRD